MKDRDRKTEIRFFSVPEWRKEQDYLRERHQNGWKFVKVNFPGIYHFEKCEPEDVIYQLDYNQEGIAHKMEYIQMFDDCGWEYLQDLAGYSYFRKPVSQMDGEEEIFCDDSSRLDMMTRVLRGRMLPLIVIFLCIIIPQLFIQGQYNHYMSTILFYTFLMMFILYLGIFASFGYQFWKYWKTLRKGD